jgi:alkylation response protein AidB-like acyl-CoA dehydrogenase
MLASPLGRPWYGGDPEHALRFEDFPATRIAWPGHLAHPLEAAGGHNQCLFTAIIVGIVETAIEAARQQVARRHEALRAYERVEWTRAEQEGWLI